MEKEMHKNKKKTYNIIEGNILEYPVFSMQKSRSQNIAEYVWEERGLERKKITKRKFVIGCEIGLPNYFDMDVFNGIMRLFVRRENGETNKIYFTVYELMKELKISVNGTNVKRIKGSLERMAKTSLHFENSFLESKEKVTKIISLLTELECYEQKKGQRLINVMKVELDKNIFKSIDRKYYKLIDFDIYTSLPAGLPRRLYEFLEKKKFRKSKFKIDIRKLARRIPLKTQKISMLKKYISKTNNELVKAKVIDKWEYKSRSMIYYFTRVERFKEVEEDLFYLERLVRTFYESIDQKRISKIMVEDGRKIIQDLIEEGYSRDEIEFSLAWVADNVDKVHSIKIIPKILAQALADRESKKLKEERELLLKEKKQNEKKEIEVEEKQQRELEKEFKKLNKQEQEKITKKARENLIKQGTKPEFIIEPVLKIERDKILLKRSQKTLVEN
jgi:hypothetical protein